MRLLMNCQHMTVNWIVSGSVHWDGHAITKIKDSRRLPKSPKVKA